MNGFLLLTKSREDIIYKVFGKLKKILAFLKNCVIVVIEQVNKRCVLDKMEAML